MPETRNSNKMDEKRGRGPCRKQETQIRWRGTLTGAETDDPHVEEVEVGDAGLGLVHLVQPAPWAPLLAKLPLPRRCQQWPRRRLRLVSLAGGHYLPSL
uniref:Predicted protein n=1 Tax=Hordeum vulgare subsp. vulgare TaxID=112509 RepID=F2E584_HORVV|nr:predicted protein [Hordeum vulgare subsp. vulgare]